MSSSDPHAASQSPAGLPMLHALASNWWLLLLRALCAILFGVLTFAWPGVTLLTLVLFYGAYALVDGVIVIAAAVRGGAPAPRWWLAVVGLLGIAAGVVTLLLPGMTALLLLLFIAGWAIASGAMQIIGAIRLRKEIDNEWSLSLEVCPRCHVGFVLPAPSQACPWRPSATRVGEVVTVAGALALRIR